MLPVTSNKKRAPGTPGIQWLVMILLLCAWSAAPADQAALDASQPAVSLQWQSPLRQQHPLVGQIYDMRSGQPIDEKALLQALSDADILLLGEKHDNPDHHQLRLGLLRQLLTTAEVTLVAMEMLDAEQQALINSVQASHLAEDDLLRSHLQWQEGWQWSFYAPVLREVLAAGAVTLAAANLSREEVMAAYASEPATDGASKLTESALARLRQDLIDSHCGLLPDARLPAMLQVQLARDQRMATSLRVSDSELGTGQRILLAGNYHVRHDLGVSNYLSESAGLVLSLAFIEVSDEGLQAADYLSADASDNLPWDFIWFTPALTDEDYCDSLR